MSDKPVDKPVQPMAAALMTAMDMLQPVFEAGVGLRAKLEEQGWSPTVAESMAHEVVLSVIRQIK